MPPIRIVLGAMPKLLGEIVRETLAAHPDFELLADVSECTDLAPALARSHADVAVVALAPRATPQERRRVSGELLAVNPRLRLVALSTDGRTAYVYELAPHEAAIGEISPHSLLEAVRGTPPPDVHETGRF